MEEMLAIKKNRDTCIPKRCRHEKFWHHKYCNVNKNKYCFCLDYSVVQPIETFNLKFVLT